MGCSLTFFLQVSLELYEFVIIYSFVIKTYIHVPIRSAVLTKAYNIHFLGICMNNYSKLQ